MVGGVGVLLDEHVASRHNVHHDHFHRHSTGEEELRGGTTGDQPQPGGEGSVSSPPRWTRIIFILLKQCNSYLTQTQIHLTQEVMGSEGSVRGGGGGAYRLVRSRSLNLFPIKDRALSTCSCVPAATPVGEFGAQPGCVQEALDV